MAKVILINGSPRENGCTARALDEMIKVLTEEGIETELFQIGKNDIRGCVACNGCQKLGPCYPEFGITRIRAASSHQKTL